MTTHDDSGAPDFEADRQRTVDADEVLKLSSPADVRAAIPYLLGFTPERSLVFLGLGTSRDRLMVTGRIDAPTTRDAARDCTDAMARAIVRAEARRVLVAYFGPLPRGSGPGRAPVEPGTAVQAVVRDLAGTITDRLESAGIDVLGWVWEATDGAPHVHAPPPIAVATVMAGRRTFASRAEVAELVAPRPSAQRPVIAETIARLDALRLPTEDLATAFDELLAARGRWPDDGQGLPPLSGQQAALCCLALARIGIRDALIGSLAQAELPSYEDLWCDVLHVAPEEAIAPVASILAIEVYMNGNGVLARCALDRALAADPDYSLAHLVLRSLDCGLPPQQVRDGFASAWDEVCVRDDASRQADP